MQPAPGTIIGGKYQLEAMLAKGGMGAVWRAKHVQLRSDVAIKFMEPSTVASPTWRARFEREARAAAQLHYIHVVHVHDFGVEEDTPYLVMELLRGESLEDRLKREHRLTVMSLLPIAVQIAKGLRRAHDAGLVHRDLKPANVFLVQSGDEDEIVKIVDFGIAKDTGAAVGDSTKPGEFIGSPHYMSPEQIQDPRNIDGRSDLWSLGVILFRALTGALPFPGENLGIVIGNIMYAPMPVPSQYVRGLPAGIDAFFERAFARDRAQRFQSAREMAEAFAVVAGVRASDPPTWLRMSSSAVYPLGPMLTPPTTVAPSAGDVPAPQSGHDGGLGALAVKVAFAAFVGGSTLVGAILLARSALLGAPSASLDGVSTSPVSASAVLPRGNAVLIALESASKPASPGTASVRVRVSGGTCSIAINGVSQKAPPVSAEVPAGLTKVTCTTPSRVPHQKEVAIEPGETGEVVFTLQGAAQPAPKAPRKPADQRRNVMIF